MFTVPKKSPTKIRISFVGDSITLGLGSTKDNDLKEDGLNGYPLNGAKDGHMGYPYKIGKILEKKGIADEFELLDFGFSGRHVMKKEDMEGLSPDNKELSYHVTCDYAQALTSTPNAVVFMLGTNDILHDPKFYDNDFGFKEKFKRGYLEITKKLKSLPSRPTLYVMIPPPLLYKDLEPGHIGPFLSTQWLPNYVRELAREISIPSDHVINLQPLFPANKAAKLLPDSIHPNDEGYQLIAQKVYETVIWD